MSVYHRKHPVMTDEEIDYDHTCKTCVHFSTRTKRKVKIISCALVPMLDGAQYPGQSRDAFPACARWQRKSKET